VALRNGFFLVKPSNMIKVNIVNTGPYSAPAYQTPGSAGMDLYACINEPVELAPLERQLIPTGIHIALPSGLEAQVRPRSGLALKKGLTCLNSPGTIDSDYRGMIGVILVNVSNSPQSIAPGERIAQLVIAHYEHIEWEPVNELPNTTRNAGGFGSTGQ
jgi:dUTP pyrophosphatase